MRKRGDVSDGGQRRPGPPEIDFLSPAFNRIDELQDGGANYRTFEGLEGIVTADMRHRLGRQGTGDSAREDLPAAGGSRNEPPNQVVDAPETARITLTSHGRVLVLARDTGRATTCVRILEGRGMVCTLVVTEDGSAAARTSPSGGSSRGARAVEVRGAFGAFAATRESEGGAGMAITASILGERSCFDCVLDLQPASSYAGALLPAGYYAVGDDPGRLDEALAELPQMQGRFEKPQFTVLREGRCLRGRSRAATCARCLEICPFEAIAPTVRGVVVDHAVCQGCGACALACPADAIRAVRPSSTEVIEQLRTALEHASAPGGPPPELVICEADGAGRAQAAGTATRREGRPVPPRVVFPVEQICHVRLETLLSAFVHGAGALIVTCPETTPRIEQTVRAQTVAAAAILDALGLRGDRIRFTVASPEARDRVLSDATAPEPQLDVAGAALSDRPEDGAVLVRAAAQELYDRSGRCDPSLPLPEGAPFGTLELEADRCTLCMACAAVCPSGALAAPGDTPRLEFRESRCRQCGLCAGTCPEGALRLLPRLLCDPLALERPIALREEDAARCLACGAPFAPRAMIDRMRLKLQNHWMYVEDRQMRRLELCRTCRARDAFVSGDVRQWAP